MSASLLLTLVVGQLPLELDASFTGGFGSGISVGGFVQGKVKKEAWTTPAASGAMSVGVLLGYQVEPYGFFAAYFPGTSISGANHRVEAWLVGGHDVQFLQSRRLLLGVEVFAGWVHLFVRGSLSDPELGVSRLSEANAGAFAAGVALKLGVRVTERVWVTARGYAPFPWATAVTPYVLGSLGLGVDLL